MITLHLLVLNGIFDGDLSKGLAVVFC